MTPVEYGLIIKKILKSTWIPWIDDLLLKASNTISGKEFLMLLYSFSFVVIRQINVEQMI